MIKSIIEVKCKHCDLITKIKVKSIDELQEEIKQLKNELRKYTKDDSVDFLRDIFNLK